jgi:broad specificity phosphatase PhoE
MDLIPGTRLVLVRHGETEANVNQLWHGALDAPLTPRGEQQVAATAAYLAQQHRIAPFAAFYVSPLPRARSTAAAIADATGIAPVIKETLREFDLGDWEGRSFRELQEQENLWGRWAVDPTFAPPNGESPVSFTRRAIAALEEVACKHPTGRILVVTHGGFISSVLSAWLGERPGDWRAFDPHNCAISVVVRTEQGWHGEVVNETGHLPATVLADYEPGY